MAVYQQKICRSEVLGLLAKENNNVGELGDRSLFTEGLLLKRNVFS